MGLNFRTTIAPIQANQITWRVEPFLHVDSGTIFNPSTEFMGGDELIMVSNDDVNGFALYANKLLSNRRLWRLARRQGYKAAQKFHPCRVAKQVEKSLFLAQSSTTNQVPTEIF